MKLSIAQIRRVHRWNLASPYVALAVLLAIVSSHGMIGGTVDRQAADARVREVGARMAELPYRLGDWVGRDVQLPAAALEILHSAAVVSRSYTHLRSGQQARLAIVYCGDARDMLGHHPPVCYPRSGWNTVRIDGDPRPAALEFEIDGRAVRANLYRFEKPDGAGLERQITILGFFALPGVGMTPEDARVRESSTSRSRSALGVGQIQVLLDGHPSVDEVRAVAINVLSSLPPGTFRILLGESADIAPAQGAPAAPLPGASAAVRPQDAWTGKTEPGAVVEHGGFS